MKRFMIGCTLALSVLWVSSAYASISSYSSTISIKNIGTSSYDVVFSAKTKSSLSSPAEVEVKSFNYYNEVAQRTKYSSEYNTNLVSHSGTITKSKSRTSGKWEIISEHNEYKNSGVISDSQESYDYDYWDPNIE